MSSAIRQLFLLAGLTLLGFAIYVALFWAGVATPISILFYRGVALAIAAAVATGIVGLWLGRRTSDSSLPIAAAALSFSFNICFLVLLPVTVDRSVSVYLLSTIEQRQDAGIDADGLQRAFINGYVINMGAVDRRIDEQRKSGNIVVASDGQLHLTERGRHFMALSRLVAQLFGTDQRFVHVSDGPKAIAAPARRHRGRNLSKHN
jgi:hypothetical protein